MGPTLRQQMRSLSLEALRAGIHDSDSMREYIAQNAGCRLTGDS